MNSPQCTSLLPGSSSGKQAKQRTPSSFSNFSQKLEKKNDLFEAWHYSYSFFFFLSFFFFFFFFSFFPFFVFMWVCVCVCSYMKVFFFFFFFFSFFPQGHFFDTPPSFSFWKFRILQRLLWGRSRCKLGNIWIGRRGSMPFRLRVNVRDPSRSFLIMLSSGSHKRNASHTNSNRFFCVSQIRNFRHILSGKKVQCQTWAKQQTNFFKIHLALQQSPQKSWAQWRQWWRRLKRENPALQRLQDSRAESGCHGGRKDTSGGIAERGGSTGGWLLNMNWKKAEIQTSGNQFFFFHLRSKNGTVQVSNKIHSSWNVAFDCEIITSRDMNAKKFGKKNEIENLEFTLEDPFDDGCKWTGIWKGRNLTPYQLGSNPGYFCS